MEQEDWQTSCKDIKQRAIFLRKTQSMSDCTLLVGPEESNKITYKAHKLILTMSSPVFEAMFFNGSPEQDTFVIPDVEPKLFEALLNYIYEENIIITSFEQARKIYMVAKKYLIPQLAMVCVEYMISNVTVETALAAYEAGEKFQDQVLKCESMQVIKMNVHELLHHKSFEEADMKTVAEIFSLEDLNVEEIEFYRALERHVDAHSSRKRCSSTVEQENGIEATARRAVRPALKHIRFLTFTLEGFAKGPARSVLLTRTEALPIILNIAKANGVPMPPGFSTNTKVRFQRPLTPVAKSPLPATSGVLRLTMSNFLTSCVSAPCMMLKNPWVLKVIPYKCISLNSIFETDYLSVYLKCESTASTPWVCLAHVDFKLLAAKCEKKDVVKHLEGTFTIHEREFGIEQFIKVFDARNEDNGYILRDGKITFEATVVLQDLDYTIWQARAKATTSSVK